MPVRAGSLRLRGGAVVYRLFDVGYGIALERALDLLRASAPERVRPVRGEAQAIRIPNPPVSVILGTERVARAKFPRRLCVGYPADPLRSV